MSNKPHWPMAQSTRKNVRTAAEKLPGAAARKAFLQLCKAAALPDFCSGNLAHHLECVEHVIRYKDRMIAELSRRLSEAKSVVKDL